MKKHHIIITTIFVLLNTIIYAQSIEPGLYKCANTFIYVEGDTILMNYANSNCLYKGLYSMIDTSIILKENVLLGKNAYIETETCPPDRIEINFICKYQHTLLGAPMVDTAIYEDESDFYYIQLNDWRFESHDKTGIYIIQGQLTQEVLSSGFLLIEAGLCLSGFQDYFNIPLKYGTRYIIKQKYFHSYHPLIINSKYKMSFNMYYGKINRNITILNINDQLTKYQYVSPNCDSCTTELNNKFPLLFE